MKNMLNSNSIIKMNTDKEFMSMKRWETKKVEAVWKKTKMDKKRKILKKKKTQTNNQSSTLSTSSRTSKKSTRTVI